MKIERRYLSVGMLAAAFAAAVVLGGCGEATDVQVTDADPSEHEHDHDHDHDHEHDHDHDYNGEAEAAVPDDYPLTTCVVSGETLGDHGEPYAMEVEGELVLLCCEPCKPEVEEDPEAALAKLEEARQ